MPCGSRRAQQRARPAGRRRRFEIVEVLVDHGFDLGSESALSESSSKSACAFPVISSARRVRPSSASSRSLRRRSLSSLDLFGWSLRLGLGRQGLAGTSLACLAPLGDVRGVQALPTQQRSPLIRTRRERVVLFEDPGLEVSGKASPPWPGSRVELVHPAIMGAREQRCSRHCHRSRCSGLALEGWSATEVVSRHPDRQGSPGSVGLVLPA